MSRRWRRALRHPRVRGRAGAHRWRSSGPPSAPSSTRRGTPSAWSSRRASRRRPRPTRWAPTSTGATSCRGSCAARSPRSRSGAVAVGDRDEPSAWSLGAAGGWVGGWLDEAAMRVTDAVYGFPAVLSALLVAAVFGPGVLISMVAVGIAYVPVFARLTRASVLVAPGAGVRHGRAGARGPGRRDPLAARPAQHGLAAHRAGDHLVPAGDPGRGGPVVPRARDPAAPSLVGAHAAGGPELPRSSPRGTRSFPGRPSRSPCSASTCSATGSATSWTRATS